MTANLLPWPRAKFFAPNTNYPLAGGKVYTYAAGTSTPLASYTDVSGSIANANPVILDANGEAPIYLGLGLSYKINILDASNIQVTGYPVDNIIADDVWLRSDLANTSNTALGAALVGYFRSVTGWLGRTISDRLFDRISVKDFGAVGDGVTNDAVAFATAITAALARNKSLYIPAGKYVINSLITVTMPNAAVGPSATNYFAQLTMFGDGFSNTEVSCTSTGFIKVIGSSQQHSLDLQDFALTTGANGTSKAIEMDCSAYPFFGEWTARSRIKLHFRGNDGINNVHYWGTCVDAIDWSNIDFGGSLFDGASTPNGTGVVTRKSAGSYVCVFDFVNTHFRFLSVGYNYGTGSQTANIDAAFFAQNLTDVYAPAGGVNHQGLSITNSECYKGGAGDGVYLACSVPNFVFSGNRWGIHAGYRGVALDVANQTTIIANQFFPDVTPNTATSAIDIDGTVAGSICVIDNNNFASTTIGARLKSGSNAVQFGAGNKCTAGMTLVSDAGTNNIIGTVLNSQLSRIGFGTGAGSSNTQLTSKSTTVVVNTPCGQITTNNAALGANTEVAFTVTNASVSVTDVVYPVVGNANYLIRVTDTAAGSFVLRLKNNTAGSLSDAVVINFIVLKASNA